MSRLFDLAKRPFPPTTDEKADVIRAALAAAELDENARKLGELLGTSQSVEAVQYARERRGQWTIEHGRAGDDYFFQLHPLKNLNSPWDVVIAALIAVMDGVFPRSVEIDYRRPDDRWQIKFFTVKVRGVSVLPGWERAVARALETLANVPA